MWRLFWFLIGRNEIFTTFDSDSMSKIIYILHKNGVKYYTNSKYYGSGSRRSGTWRAYGEQTQYETQHYIYVKREDHERALYLIRENYR